jgi:hypothetical protein
MSSALRQSIRQEVDLVHTFTRSYRAKLAKLIDCLNHTLENSGSQPDRQSIRWCVEAVDMMLASQEQFAKAMDKLARCDAA